MDLFGGLFIGGSEAGKLGGREAGRLGSWEAGKLGGLEARRPGDFRAGINPIGAKISYLSFSAGSGVRGK